MRQHDEQNRDGKGMKCSIEKISPLRAAALLRLNKRNRPVKRQNLVFLCDELRSGRWQVNGDAIRITTDGDLLDGQHRLMAVVQTGISIDTLVIYGVDACAFETIDTGAARSNADALTVGGEKNSRNLAAALTLMKDLMGGNTSFIRTVKISNTEIVGLLEKNPDVRGSVRWGNALVRLVPPSAAIALHCLFSRVDKIAADSFFDHVHSGLDMTFDNPAFVLRQRLIENATSKSKITRRYLIALMIKAWNAYRKGQKIKFLRFREEGEAPETFPDWR